MLYNIMLTPISLCTPTQQTTQDDSSTNPQQSKQQTETRHGYCSSLKQVRLKQFRLQTLYTEMLILQALTKQRPIQG